ncbi:glycosyltransferase family 4 protein [Macrococcoides canis]|uniref:glycosyltransferase family 4 protein n=1 Tax=Macrococcoides canis TaxID=1855823 RepID=UPI001AA01E4C|nr:glycosyltransferase family 4 protein [Macrococcus canis]
MKIVVAGHDLKFIQFFIEYLSKKTDVELKIDQWKGHVDHDIEYSYDLLDWADVIFCEWGLGNIQFYSNNKRKHQKLVVRLHRQELETSYLNNSNINNIDQFILISPYIYDEFSRKFDLPRNKMKLIYNAVDLEKFNNCNNPDRKYKLGMVGYLPKLKRMDLALDIFEKLYQVDNRYTLTFKGKKPEELKWLMKRDAERVYYEQQYKRIDEAEWKDNVHFEGFGDVVEFYNNIEFILSLSDIESFHLAVAEGLACGAIPIIHNWEGSDTIYNEEYNIDDLDNIISHVNKLRKSYSYNKDEVSKFNKDKICNQIYETINN